MLKLTNEDIAKLVLVLRDLRDAGELFQEVAELRRENKMLREEVNRMAAAFAGRA